MCLQGHLAKIRQEGRYRIFKEIQRTSGQFPRGTLSTKGVDKTTIITTFCSNDYLSMGQHPVVLSAMRDAITTGGAGAGGTRNISGTSPTHTKLEQELADLHQKDQALLFSSGFVANASTLSTLGKLLPGCIFFSDENNHASLIEGIRHSGCEKRIFRHNNMRHLDLLLRHLENHCIRINLFDEWSRVADWWHL
jgi:5-aminolevulinate synthase